jgi:hypothetical protein
MTVNVMLLILAVPDDPAQAAGASEPAAQAVAKRRQRNFVFIFSP